MDEIARILATAASSSAAIRALYERQKKNDVKFSLALLCRRAGIASRGNLSDVMAGKRALHRRYHASIVKAFELKGEEARCLKLLLSIDRERSHEKRQHLREQLEIVKKTLAIQERRIVDGTRELFFGLEVFCAFGLFANLATPEQLQAYFTSARRREIDDALALLASLDLIERSDTSASYRVKSSHVVFNESVTNVSHIEFLKLALAHAAKNVEHWFSQKTHSYFDSSAISVKESHYVAALAELKTDMLRRQAELESGDADMIVRFNVQVYPISPAIKKNL